MSEGTNPNKTFKPSHNVFDPEPYCSEFGTRECFNVGMSGGCGPDCSVYLRGECSESQEIIALLYTDELERHWSLYG